MARMALALGVRCHMFVCDQSANDLFLEEFFDFLAFGMSDKFFILVIEFPFVDFNSFLP